MNRKISEEEQRLTILYALHRLNGCTEDQLRRFLTALDLSNYFIMKLNLIPMEDQQLILCRNHPAGLVLTAAPEGLQALSLLSAHLPASVRSRIDEGAAVWGERFRLEMSLPVRTVPLPDGGCEAFMSLLEGSSAIMTLQLRCGSVRDTYGLPGRWQTHAAALWRDLIALLSEGYDPSAPALHDTAPAENGSGVITLTIPGDPFFMLQLSLPSRLLCRHCAARWTHVAEKWQQETCALLLPEDPQPVRLEDDTIAPQPGGLQ